MFNLQQIHLAFVVSLSTVQAYASESSYNHSPSTRTIYPVSIYAFNGSVENNGPVFGFDDIGNAYTLAAGSAITYDFGQMIAGILTVNIGLSTGTPLKVSYSESSLFVGPDSDESVLYGENDGALPITASPFSSVTVNSQYGRGSFRYVTLTATGSTQIQGISNYYTALPGSQAKDLRNYTGHFLSSDQLLNKIWYAGAYTNQLCLIAANSSVDHLTYIVNGGGWANNATVSPLQSTDVFLADGAKRDRNPWAGDFSIAVASVAVSQNVDNLTSVKNSLRGMLILQSNLTHYFPYAGSPLGAFLNPLSDTYHMWTIAGFGDYVLRSNDTTFGIEHIAAIVRGVEAVRAQIDTSTNLFNGSGSSDWGRVGLTGTSIATNAILYHTLQTIIQLGSSMNSNSLNSSYLTQLSQTADGIKSGVNTYLFDSSAGLYYDNTTTAGHTLYPQDGNSYALRYNLTQSSAQAQQISDALAGRLGLYGAPAPELPTAISPFISGHEIEGHFIGNPTNSTNAMSLLRRQWGYMQKFSESTLLEGYATDGSLKYAFYPTASFISHAHAWSTGPTASLMNHIVGVSQATASTPWIFAPQYIGAGLSCASGGFSAGNSIYEASWQLSGNGTLSASLNVTSTSTGIIRFPARGTRLMYVNGVQISGTTRAGQIEVVGLSAGQYKVVY